MFKWLPKIKGFPGDAVVKDLLPMQETQETWVRPLDWVDPLEQEMATRQYSCLENSMYRGAWRATVHKVVNSQT